MPLSNDAWNRSVCEPPAGISSCGTSENAVLLVASMNSNSPEAPLSVNWSRPSEEAWGITHAVVAASPLVASAMFETSVIQRPPERTCRFTTMLPIVAGSLPRLTTVTWPEMTSAPGSGAPGVAVTVQLTVLPLRCPVFSRLQGVCSAWLVTALASSSAMSALAARAASGAMSKRARPGSSRRQPDCVAEKMLRIVGSR
jgi:hypothetical protein